MTYILGGKLKHKQNPSGLRHESDGMMQLTRARSRTKRGRFWRAFGALVGPRNRDVLEMRRTLLPSNRRINTFHRGALGNWPGARRVVVRALLSVARHRLLLKALSLEWVAWRVVRCAPAGGLQPLRGAWASRLGTTPARMDRQGSCNASILMLEGIRCPRRCTCAPMLR